MRGQYEGYHDVAGVAPRSTDRDLRRSPAGVDSWRWAGVPIVIRAGKCLPVTATEVTIRFRHPPRDLFGLAPTAAPQRAALPDLARDRGQADPRGQEARRRLGARRWRSCFAQQPGCDMRPYDRLIGAALDGERWLFARQETVEAAWRIVDPILGDAVPVHPYPKGSWGPDEADRLLPDRDTWHDPTG